MTEARPDIEAATQAALAELITRIGGRARPVRLPRVSVDETAMRDLCWIVRRTDAGRWLYYVGLNDRFTGPVWDENPKRARLFALRRSAEDVARQWGGYVQARPAAA